MPRPTTEIHKNICAVFAVLFVCTAAVNSRAQTITSYDVIAIRENRSPDDARSIGFSDAGFQATNISLKTLIASAYGVPEARVKGLTGWAARNRYDVSAKWSNPGASLLKDQSTEHRRERVKNLLEKFSLTVHLEIKPLRGYRLEIAEKGPRPGLHLVQTAADAPDGSVLVSENQISMEASSLQSLSAALSSELGKPVADATGLTGRYTLEAQWDQNDCREVIECQAGLFSALKEQVGLRLVPANVRATVVIVDRVEPPTPL